MTSVSSKSPSSEGSDGEKEKNEEYREGNGDSGADVGERESADGGSSPPDQHKPQGAEGGQMKEAPDNIRDLDKDIDAVLECNVNNGQINPDLSVDSTLDSTKPGQEETNTDGMPSVRDEELPLSASAAASVIDVNGNVEGAEKGSLEVEASLKAKDGCSEKSFTSDTDSSVVAETIVKNALNVAMTVLKSDVNGDGNEDMNNRVDCAGVSGGGSNKTNQGDVKVGLFQYDFGDEDRVNSEDDIYERTPCVSDEEESTDEHVESMTEDDKADIMKLYGLDGMEPVSPKSASPPGTGSSGFLPAEQLTTEQVPTVQDGERTLDVQRDVYEAQTKMFVVTRDPSSSESTPRNGNLESIKDMVVFDNLNVIPSEDIPIDTNDIQISRENSGDSVNSQKDSQVSQDQEQDRNDDPISLMIETRMSQDISPPLVQYEPVKENGKFRIVKTSKEGGGIRVGKDMSTPEQSPRSESSQKSDLSEPKRPPVDIGNNQSSREQFMTQDPSNIQDRHMSRKSSNESQKDLSAVEIQLLTAPSGFQGTESEQPETTKNPMQHSSEQNGLQQYSQQIREQNKSNERQDLSSSLRSQNSEKSVDYSSIQKEESRKSHFRTDTTPHETLAARSPRELRVSELDAGHGGRRDEQSSVDTERIRYTTRNTDGVETRRTGPVPYDVSYPSALGQPACPYNKERYESRHEDPTRSFSASYREELIQSAYSRVPPSQDPRSQSLPGRGLQESGVIPSFKTLQEQQASWTGMFRQLEDQHRRELRSQYEHHQFNIQRLQQQMELELQKQHAAIRKKLDVHREKLEQMNSPERAREDMERRSRSHDKSPSAERHQRSVETPDRERRQHDIEDDTSHESKTWREIYREVRAEEDRRDSGSPPPIRRSLDQDFSTLNSTVDDTRSSLARHSPRGQSYSRSSERDRSRSSERSFERSRERSNDMSRSDDERSRAEGYSSYERKDKEISDNFSRSSQRNSRSKSQRKPLSPMIDGDKDGQSVGQFAAENVSQHIQQLLNNLQDTRSSLRNIEGDLSQDGGQERPRAGVYSSPMPMFKGRGSKSSPRADKSVSLNTSLESRSMDQSRLSSQQQKSVDQSRLSSLFEDRAEFHEDSLYLSGKKERKDKDKANESLRGEDLDLSSRERLNLREKHSKHLADLRAYYEDELRDLRKALTDSLDTSQISADVTLQTTVQSQLLEAENKHLLDKCRTMEDELEELYSRVRTLEQKNLGLEKRASEYAGAFTESQTMAIQHQAHIEELQRYCRERDDLITNLESKIISQEDSVKIYKKSLDEEMELHRQDKMALQRIIDKYESLEREYKLLQETMGTTETRLYEARTEIVELNRTISKMELENKRIGRENDNLRHKITQSLNLSTLHESFGSPTSPRSTSIGHNKSPGSNSHNQNPSSTVHPPPSLTSDPRPGSTPSTDRRVPGFATSSMDWSSSLPKSKSYPACTPVSRTAATERSTGVGRVGSTDSLNSSQKAESKSKRRDESQRKAPSKPRTAKGEEVSRNSCRKRPEMNGDLEHVPTRDTSSKRRDQTPPRAQAEEGFPDSDGSDFSPLLKAERELFKLRDMMRQAVAVTPSASPPPEPKLQKKFYGSERPNSKEDYRPDLSTARVRKDKQAANSHTGVVKSKTGSQQPRYERSEKSSKKSSGKSDKSSRSKDTGSARESRERTLDGEEQRPTTPTRRNFSVNSALYDSPTRFDIDINDDKKTVTLSQKKAGYGSPKSKGSSVSRSIQTREDPVGGARADQSESGNAVENTLDRIRGGQYTTRPEWEDVFTSLAKPRPETQDKVKSMTKEEKIKDRLKMISEMESRYDGLQIEKRQLESSLNKIPMHGRVDRNNRKHKEEIEDRLDVVEKELGSLRMSLKRYNVLKTAG